MRALYLLTTDLRLHDNKILHECLKFEELSLVGQPIRSRAKIPKKVAFLDSLPKL